VGIKSYPNRSRRWKANAFGRQMIAFGAIGAAVAFIARHPMAFLQVATGLLALAMGLYLFEHFRMWPPSKDQAGSEIRAPAKPVSAAQSSAGDVRQDEPAVVKPRSNNIEAAPPAKKLPQTSSIIAPRDAALDSWFIKAYLRCWTQPTTLPPGEKYAAQIRVVHNDDGSLTGAPLLVTPPSNPAWRSFADSAVQAVTKCNPLQVPPRYQAHFEQWRKMTLYFSPDSALE
jgi:hypothetical protein